MQEILHAAGVESLDEPSDALNAKGKPFRRHGIVLHVAISYQNSDSSFLGTGYGFSRIPSFHFVARENSRQFCDATTVFPAK